MGTGIIYVAPLASVASVVIVPSNTYTPIHADPIRICVRVTGRHDSPPLQQFNGSVYVHLILVSVPVSDCMQSTTFLRTARFPPSLRPPHLFVTPIHHNHLENHVEVHPFAHPLPLQSHAICSLTASWFVLLFRNKKTGDHTAWVPYSIDL